MLIATVLFSILGASAPIPSPPAFESFPVPIHTFRAVKPNVAHGKAHRYRTVLRQSAAEGPDFAGEYKVARWGCGTCCSEFAIINLRTGVVYFPPFYVACEYSTESQSDPIGIDYRADSRLLVVTGARNEVGGGIHYYVWTGRRLRLAFSVER
ncbi:MAG TPA: hypothetical protein VLC46_03535 [Thermoanaerobaculia bacterium]|jgi:hypothetical protein|nr:hypothetical protein [Thermoanaerobaculia bacterium]